MDGIIIINKSKNCTSHDVVSKIKKILKVTKVGHTGTLDPNATGVLPILIGQGTKLSRYLINHDKIYEVTLKLGEKTDTADSEGNIIEKKDVDISLITDENIKEVLNKFLGKQQQVPPMYSAIKVKGKKLYEYARKGETVEVKPREIEIYNIEYISKNGLEIQFRVSCSKGTYIRSLCEDIAKEFNTVGYMKELNRTKVGKFSINQSISIDYIEENRENLNNCFITIEDFLKDKKSIELDEKRMKAFLNGVKLACNLKEDLYRIYDNNKKFIGTGIIEKNRLKRDIIL